MNMQLIKHPLKITETSQAPYCNISVFTLMSPGIWKHRSLYQQDLLLLT